MKQSKVYSITYWLSILLGIFALFSLVVSAAGAEYWDQYKGFLILPLYMCSILWVLWIGCALFGRSSISRKNLFLLWVQIDIVVLFIFLSLSMSVDNWSSANGIDLVILLAYFPVIFPIGLLFSLLPQGVIQTIDLLINSTGGALNSVMVWFSISVIAAVQSILVVGMSELLTWRKRKNSLFKTL